MAGGLMVRVVWQASDLEADAVTVKIPFDRIKFLPEDVDEQLELPDA